MRKNKVEMNDLIIEKVEENEIKSEEKTTKNILIGGGRPKKNESEKAKNKIVLYFTDLEIQKIKESAELDGFELKHYQKYAKKALLKTIRREVGGI